MKEEVFIYPKENSMVSVSNLKVWIKFNNVLNLDLSSLTMELNGDKVPAVINTKGLIYDYKSNRKQGINKIKVHWRNKKGEEREHKWRFGLLEKSIGIVEYNFQCMDFSKYKSKEIDFDELFNMKGIAFFSQKQLENKVFIGRGRQLIDKMKFIEFLKIKTPTENNISNLEEYIYGISFYEDRGYKKSTIILYEHYDFEEGKKTNEVLVAKKDIDRLLDHELKSIDFFGLEGCKNMKKGFKQYLKVLDRGYKFGIWGMGYHRGEKVFIKLFGKNLDPGFFEGIEKKRTVISCVQRYSFGFSINGRIVGDTLEPEFINKLNIFIKLEDDENFVKEIKVFAKSGKIIFDRKGINKKNVVVNEEIIITGAEYAVCIVICKENKWIITSPIWIK